jgi:hypothetical protein
MSGKIEISRELLERLVGIANKSYDIEDAMRAGAQVRTLLAAPVVERQEPVAWMWTHENGLQMPTTKENSPFYEGKGGFTKTALYISPPSPEAPRQEPIMHITPQVLGMLKGELRMQSGGITFSESKPIGNWTVPLYTSPPAPVAVLGLDVFKALEKVKELNQ